jgi:hypothetical protein
MTYSLAPVAVAAAGIARVFEIGTTFAPRPAVASTLAAISAAAVVSASLVLRSSSAPTTPAVVTVSFEDEREDDRRKIVRLRVEVRWHRHIALRLKSELLSAFTPGTLSLLMVTAVLVFGHLRFNVDRFNAVLLQDFQNFFQLLFALWISWP